MGDRRAVGAVLDLADLPDVADRATLFDDTVFDLEVAPLDLGGMVLGQDPVAILWMIAPCHSVVADVSLSRRIAAYPDRLLGPVG